MRGSIQKRGKGSWRLVFDLERDHTGRRRQKVVSFKGNKRDASLGAVAVVVEDDHGQGQAERSRGGQFESGHLERAVADDYEHALGGIRDRHADPRGDGKAHRAVIRGGDELLATGGSQADGSEQRVARVGHDGTVVVEMQTQNAKRLGDGQSVL